MSPILRGVPGRYPPDCHLHLIPLPESFYLSPSTLVLLPQSLYPDPSTKSLYPGTSLLVRLLQSLYLVSLPSPSTCPLYPGHSTSVPLPRSLYLVSGPLFPWLSFSSILRAVPGRYPWLSFVRDWGTGDRRQRSRREPETRRKVLGPTANTKSLWRATSCCSSGSIGLRCTLLFRRVWC